MAMTSLAGMMTQRSSRTTPLATPPSPITQSRSARSFMSMVRGHVMRRGSILQRVALVDMVVEHRRQQRVGAGDRVEVSGEMEVDVLHGHDLRVPAAGRPALDAEHGPETRLADAQ